jgi:hypothetical protein
MPPRRSARAAARAAACDPFGVLPDDVLLRILAAVPVDVRARCAAVRRTWRAALSPPAAWTRLDLSAATGGVARAISDEMLLAAAAKALGGLEALDVSDCASLSLDALRAVFAANAASLRTARVGGALARDEGRRLDPDEVVALLSAAPALTALHADVCCSVAEAPALLRAAPPYAPLRVARLNVDDLCLVMRLAQQGFLAAALAASEPGGLLAVQAEAEAVSEPVAELVAALRASTSMTSLSLGASHDTTLAVVAGAAASVLRALEGHGSLFALEVYVPRAQRAAEAADALGALLAADSPALRELRIVTEDIVHEDHLRPLCAALHCNTHLQSLKWLADATVSEAFAADVLLPAVQQNASLRHLHVGCDRAPQPPSARQAVALVQERAAAGA